MNHRLNMELDLQSLFGLLYFCTHWLRPPKGPNPPPLHLVSDARAALLVSQDRRHLFVTP